MTSIPTILITNDDGIDSLFLRTLAETYHPFFNLTIIAPAKEESWIAHKISKGKTLQLKKNNSFQCPAWSLSGTPADCTNTGIHNFFKLPPSLIISGVNIGANTTLSLILASGTVAGATEGIFQGVPAVAISQSVPYSINENNPVTSAKGQLVDLEKHLLNIKPTLEDIIKKGATQTLHNFNFPYQHTPECKIEKTIPATTLPSNIFSRKGNTNNFEFSLSIKEPQDTSNNSDRNCLRRGNISHSEINFQNL